MDRRETQQAAAVDFGGRAMSRPATICHEIGGRIELAARWLVETPRDQIAGSMIAEVQQRFGLDPKGACAACAEASRIREARHVHAS